MAVTFEVSSAEEEKKIMVGFVGASDLRLIRNFSPNSLGYLAVFCSEDGGVGSVREVGEDVADAIHSDNNISWGQLKSCPELFALNENVISGTVDFHSEPDEPAKLKVMYYDPANN